MYIPCYFPCSSRRPRAVVPVYRGGLRGSRMSVCVTPAEAVCVLNCLSLSVYARRLYFAIAFLIFSPADAVACAVRMVSCKSPVMQLAVTSHSGHCAIGPQPDRGGLGSTTSHTTPQQYTAQSRARPRNATAHHGQRRLSRPQRSTHHSPLTWRHHRCRHRRHHRSLRRRRQTTPPARLPDPPHSSPTPHRCQWRSTAPSHRPGPPETAPASAS